MPFTPVHLGPGALLKGFLGANFSFVVFGGSQVLIDLEPLIQLLRGSTALHGPSHTMLGALVIGLVATLLGKPIGQAFLKLIGYQKPEISWRVSAISAYLGTFSHILVDGIMHSDMAPWAPLSHHNPLLGLISVANLHYVCLGAGIVGGIWIAARYLYKTDA